MTLSWNESAVQTILIPSVPQYQASQVTDLLSNDDISFVRITSSKLPSADPKNAGSSKQFRLEHRGSLIATVTDVQEAMLYEMRLAGVGGFILELALDKISATSWQYFYEICQDLGSLSVVRVTTQEQLELFSKLDLSSLLIDENLLHNALSLLPTTRNIFLHAHHDTDLSLLGKFKRRFVILINS